MRLRSYQSEACASVIADWDSGLTDVLGVAATGLGKTQIMIALLRKVMREDQRALIVAHTRNLIQQPLDRLHLMEPEWAATSWRGGARGGLIGKGRTDYAAQITFATFQALGYEHAGDVKKHLQRYMMHGAPDYLIIDECFPAGTLIDGSPIESLRVGDMVRSLNHKTCRIEYRPITNVFRKSPQSLVCISFENGQQIVCTPNHPFYTHSDGYIAAIQLTVQHEVWYEGSQSRVSPVYDVRGDGRVQGAERSTTSTQGQSLLLGRMPAVLSKQTVLGAHEQNKSQICVCAYEDQQPNAQTRCKRAHDTTDTRDQASACSAGRQWETAANPAADACRCASMANGGYCAHDGTEIEPATTTNTLQGGHCRSCDNDCYRGRRRIACIGGTQEPGCEENHSPHRVRVARVEVLQPSSDGGFRHLCPDGYVYNIEVEGNHNYFVDGILVHNCHHANAPMLRELIATLRRVNPNLKHLGVTATPTRGDGDGLSRIYQRSPRTPSGASFLYDIGFGVREHYLVMPRGLGIATGIDMRGVESRAGDYVASQVAKRFDTDAGRAIICASWHLLGYGRRTIAFTASKDGAHELAAAFNDLGTIPPDLLAEAATALWQRFHPDEPLDLPALLASWHARTIRAIGVDGQTKDVEQILDRYRAGQRVAFDDAPYHILCNCKIAQEGFDAPGASCVLMCRPTKAQGTYIQMVGRVLRPRGDDPSRPGMAMPDEDALVLDFVPKDANKLVLLSDVLGMPKPMRAAQAKEAKKDQELGGIQHAFTFDGQRFNSDGSPLEIIARHLDFLNESPYVWYSRTDDNTCSTLGLGVSPKPNSSDEIDRILAITRDGEAATLWGIWRTRPVGTREWSAPQCRALATGSIEEMGEQGNAYAAKHGQAILTSKGRSWHTDPATSNQIAYLKRLIPRSERNQIGDNITKQEAAALITHYQAIGVLHNLRIVV